MSLGRVLSPRFYLRNFFNPITFPNLQWRINRFSHHAIGGPERASFTAVGEPTELWELIEWLRAPVEIWDWRAECIWWGYINGVTVRVGAIEMGVTLDRVANRIKVIYTDESSSTRQATNTVIDNVSQTAFGIKELTASLSQGNSSAAENKRDTLLEMLRLPIPTINVTPGKASMSATVNALGWWTTLGWRYYANTYQTQEAYTATGDGVVRLGNDAGHTMAAQGFKLDSGSWPADKVYIRCRTEGAPSDNLVVGIYTDSSGAPGALLASGSVANTSIPSDYGWVEFELDTEVTVSTTQLWIRVSRSGGLDATHHYALDLNDELGYSRGVFRLWDGAAWVARSPDSDMPFVVLRVPILTATTQQIADIVTASGQFITGTRVVTPSGISHSPARSGDYTALTEIMGLLGMGTSNHRRLLAQIDKSRGLKVYEEPVFDPTSPDYYITAAGELLDKWGGMVLSHTCPCGGWVMLKDVFPPTLDTTKLADASHFFIERSEYDPQTDKLTLEPRALRSAWDVGGFDEG